MEHEEIMLESKELFKGHVIRVVLDTVRTEDNSTAMREIVHHHGGACVMAVTEDEEVYLVRQFRYAFGEVLWELPAGKLEEGEDPFDAAKRELEEECGVTADEYTDYGKLYPTVGYDDEKIYIWMAKGLHPSRQHLDEGEFLDVVKMPIEKAYRMILSNEIRDAKTVSSILRYVAEKYHVND